MHEPINSFLHHLVVERGFSHNTLEAYRNDLYQLMTYVKGKLPSANGASTWGHIGAELLTDYVFSLRGEKSYRDSTTARKVAAIKSFFNFLVQEGHVEKDPSESLSAPTPGRSLPKFLTEEEAAALQDQLTAEGVDPLRHDAFGIADPEAREKAVYQANRRGPDGRGYVHYDNSMWLREERPKGLSSLRTSLIIDPPKSLATLTRQVSFLVLMSKQTRSPCCPKT